MNNPRVGCLTTFYAWEKSYSLTSVVESQLVSLVKYGYNPVLFVHDNFTGEVPNGVEVRKVVPRFNLIDYSANQPVSKDFNDQVDKVYEMFKKEFKDIDIVLEHDLIFQGWFLPYAAAIHKFAKESKIKWFHWTHSVPNGPPPELGEPHIFRYRLPEKSKLVYLNNFGLIRAAESYSLWPRDVHIVYNPVDPRLYWNCHPVVSQVIDKYDLLSADIVQTYPVSTPRMIDGKNLHAVIEIFAALKKLGRSVRLIVANAHANADKDKQLIKETYEFATSKGLMANELIFTSLEGYEHGIPREAVTQFLQLSNVFVFPSFSENCPLILLEAMLAKNLLILNQDVGSMRELAGPTALYFKFGSIDDRVNYSNRDNYMADVAKIILSELEFNRPLRCNAKLKKEYNYDTIFKNQIMPLLHKQ